MSDPGRGSTFGIQALKKQISNQLRAKLSHLEEAQLEHLVGRALILKGRSNDKSSDLDTWVLRAIKKDERGAASTTGHQQGQVIGAASLTVLVDCPDGPTEARLLSQACVVGDEVTIGQDPTGEWQVVETHPRRTQLSRPDVANANRLQVFAANIDLVVIVVSVVTPPLHPRLIDRYLVAVQQGGAQALVCVNKIDLLEDASELDQLKPYRSAGIRVVHCSAMQDPKELLQEIRGKTCVFVGHSGVGKSSLVNALKPDAAQEVGDVSLGYGRGTHTTTASSLHNLGDGTKLIDTPGIRSFGLSSLKRNEIAGYFPELTGVQCRFNDCTHLVEPGCRVLESLEAGTLDPTRFETYRRLMEEAKA